MRKFAQEHAADGAALRRHAAPRAEPLVEDGRNYVKGGN
jgi:hypothetical protein